MDKLRQLRQERGLTQVKLAVLADIDPSTVNQIERGAREASPASLRKLAQALDVSLAELIEEGAPKVSAPPSLFNELDEERRSEQIAQAAEALNARWIKEVGRGEFTAADYDEGGRGLYALDALLADAMSEEAVEGVAWNRAWSAVYDLQNTLQRAQEALAERGVQDLSAYRALRTEKAASTRRDAG